MKRFSWLLIIVLSFGTFGFTLPGLSTRPGFLEIASPSASSDLLTINLPIPGKNVVCKSFGAARICASVSNKTPLQYTNVTVYGTLSVNGIPKVNKVMKTTWNYRTTTSSCSGYTDVNGLANCSRYIASATKAFKVYVEVKIGTYTVETFFTPH